MSVEELARQARRPVGSAHGRVCPGPSPRRRARAAGADVAAARPDAPPAHRGARRGSGCPGARGRLRQRLDLRLARRARRPWRPGGRRRSRPVARRRAARRTSSCARATSSPARSIPASFDLVTARAVLHHVTDVDAAVRNLAPAWRRGQGPADRAGLPAGQRRRAGRGASLLGRLARLVARRRGSTITRPHPGPTARGAGPRRGRGHGRDRRLQGRLALGRLLDRDGHRATRPARGLRRARRPARRRFLAHCADPRWWTQTIAFTPSTPAPPAAKGN